MVSSHSHTHTQKKDYIVIETSNGLRCVRSHWQYYSRSTAPARQRKIKANRRQKKKKPVREWCRTTAAGPVENPTTFFFTRWLLQTAEGSLSKRDGTGEEK